MLNHIKGSLKVFYDYCMALVVFVILLYPFISFTKDNFVQWLPYFSLFIFLIMFIIIYADMKTLAIKEKRPQYTGMFPYPAKGFILGLIGFLPVIILEIAVPMISFNNEILQVLKPNILKGILGPVYVFYQIPDNTICSYIISGLVIPVVSFLGYLAGYKDFDLGVEYKKIKKKLSSISKD